MSKIVAYFDGACEPVNPGGTAAYGAVVLKDGERVWEESKIFFPKPGHEKETSNNVAEYSGFKALLEFLLSKGWQNEEIEIFGDSMLVVKQMDYKWRIKKGYYVAIAIECLNLLARFSRIKVMWIPREQNTIADKLSKRELINAGVEFRIQPEGKERA
jgi:ribonuclease HI